MLVSILFVFYGSIWFFFLNLLCIVSVFLEFVCCNNIYFLIVVDVGYDLIDFEGNIIIKWDVVEWIGDGYWV